MSASGITVTAPGVVPRASAPAIWLGGLLAGGIWLGAAAFIAWLPDEIEVGRTQELALVAAVLGGLAVLAALASSLLGETGLKLRKAGPWLSVLGPGPDHLGMADGQERHLAAAVLRLPARPAGSLSGGLAAPG
jgi:hypothetical protein